MLLFIYLGKSLSLVFSALRADCLGKVTKLGGLAVGSAAVRGGSVVGGDGGSYANLLRGCGIPW